MSHLTAKFLSDGGKIEKAPSGYAIGYVPQGESTKDIDAIADDVMAIMIYSKNPFNNHFLSKYEAAKGYSKKGSGKNRRDRGYKK